MPFGHGSPVQAAPAKINLCLHVTGRRGDGYHLLDSIVVFTELGDRVSVGPLASTSQPPAGPATRASLAADPAPAPGAAALTVTGPFAEAVPAGGDNLCLRAARAVGAACAIALEKNLPPASGIGGGTADAAAVLRALGRMPATPEALGADLPACLLSRPLRMQGVGEVLTPLGLAELHLVLVNPGRPVATPAVFAALDRRENPPLPPLPAGVEIAAGRRTAGAGAAAADSVPGAAAGLAPGAAGAFAAGADALDAAGLIRWLSQTRNDLQEAAIRIEPAVADCLAALDRAGALLSRMSGSGATCFGIFPDAASAQAAALLIAAGQAADDGIGGIGGGIAGAGSGGAGPGADSGEQDAPGHHADRHGTGGEDRGGHGADGGAAVPDDRAANGTANGTANATGRHGTNAAPLAASGGAAADGADRGPLGDRPDGAARAHPAAPRWWVRATRTIAGLSPDGAPL